MFGSTTSGFGGFNTQPNSGTSPFGGGTVAASNSAFPASNSGAFGALNTNSVFGQNTNTTSTFGASPGTNAFGLGSAGGTSAFGQPSNSAFGRGSSVFGQTTQNNTSPFGAASNSPTATSGSNIFGGLSKPFGSNFGTPQNNSITPFGGATSGSSMFGSSVDVNVNNGTAGKPFSEVIDKDAQGVSKFQNIAAMPEYKNFSVEELRLKDYEQNRRFGNTTTPNTVFGASPGSNTGIFGNNNSAFGNAGTSAFGQNNTTGAFGPSNNTSAFGSSGIFGSGNNASTGTSAFGANNTTPSGFGSAFGNTSSAFGANKPPAFGSSLGNTGTFGSNNNTTSAFESSLNNNASPFGQNNNTSAFGTTNNSPFSNNTGGGIFGNNNNAGTSAFGSNNTAKPGGLFGSSNNTFGSNNTVNNTGGLFGNSSSAFGAKPAADGLFGSNNSAQPSAFGQNTQSGGLFGQNNNNVTNNSGGLFGQNNYQSGGFFGQNNNNTCGGLFRNNNQTNNTSGGLFGNTNNNNTSGGLFGNKPAAPSGGLFGNTGTNTTSGFGSTQNNTTSGGLFGKPADTTGTGGGLFGNTNTNSTPAASGGLFGANNTNNSTGGGLFGNLNATAGTNTQSGGLFGNKSATTTGTIGGGLFGNTQNSTATNNTTGTSFVGGSSLFGGQAQQTQQQQQQSQQPLLLLSQAGQLLQPLVCGPMPSLLTRDPYGSSQLFESISGAIADANVPRAIAVSKVKKKYNLSSVHRLEPLFKAKTFNTPIEDMKMEVFSAENGDTSKTSSANNAIDQAIMSSALFAPKLDYKKLVLNSTMEPQKLIAGAEELSPKRVLFALTNIETPKQEAPLREVASSEEEIDDDGYWSSPALSQLKKMSLAHLRKVKDFTVGRKYYGQVRFREPVDLSAINLDDICGNIVVFGSKNVIIYPDDDPPKVGEGLNLPAEVTLEGCYPTNKKTKLATLDPKDEVVKRHIQQLKELPDIEFKNYDPPSGDWTFRFEHL